MVEVSTVSTAERQEPTFSTYLGVPPWIRFAFLLALLVVVDLGAGLLIRGQTQAGGLILLPWGVTAAIMVLCFAMIGEIPTGAAGCSSGGDWRRVLVDQRNKMSLSQLQLVLWTLLVISAAFTEGMVNAAWGSHDPLALQIPSRLWILLGLSTTSFVAAPVVLSGKAKTGSLHTKNKGEHAWRDIFFGDDMANADQVDFSKVQQLFFTILLLFVYTVALGSVMVGAVPSKATQLTFPQLDRGFIGIMAVSQTAYIAYKALPQKQTDAPPP